MMGQRKLKISDLQRETGLHRNSITLLYKETAHRVDFQTLNELCLYFNCTLDELIEYIPDE